MGSGGYRRNVFFVLILIVLILNKLNEKTKNNATRKECSGGRD